MTGTRVFDTIEVGATIGTDRLTLDAALLADWYRVFRPGAAPERVSAAFLMAIMMRGYIVITAPRPAGNVQAQHRIVMLGSAGVGDEVETTITCIGKAERKGRKWVTFSGSMTSAGRRVLEVEMVFLWAA